MENIDNKIREHNKEVANLRDEQKVSENGESLDVANLDALDVIGSVEDSNEDDSTFGEQEGQYRKSHASAKKQIQGSQIVRLPERVVMIEQTVEAINVEIEKIKKEIDGLLKSRSNQPYLFNIKVKRLRTLTGILNELKNLAQITEDYLVGLWKEFVGKIN